MTDNEIIKALECCVDWCGEISCWDCPLKHTGCIHFNKLKETLDIINRQKAKIEALQMDNQQLQSDIANANMNADHALAEIERLSDRNHKCVYLSDDETTEFCVDGPCPEFKTVGQIKAEAIKEFAERLKEMFPQDEWLRSTRRMSEVIDNLVKEMVGDNNG